jgi:hypothetical protein
MTKPRSNATMEIALAIEVEGRGHPLRLPLPSTPIASAITMENHGYARRLKHS